MEGSLSAFWMTHWDLGNSMIIWQKAISENFAKHAKILRLLQKYSKTNSAKW